MAGWMAYRDGLDILVGYWRLCLACLAFLRNGIYESLSWLLLRRLNKLLEGTFYIVQWDGVRYGSVKSGPTFQRFDSSISPPYTKCNCMVLQV